MLGMNWSGKLIATQESIDDREGSVILTAVHISDSLSCVNTIFFFLSQSQHYTVKKKKVPEGISFKAISSACIIQIGSKS